MAERELDYEWPADQLPPGAGRIDAHAVAWAAGPGIQTQESMLDSAARLIEDVERRRRFWCALAIINGTGFGGALAALCISIWG